MTTVSSDGCAVLSRADFEQYVANGARLAGPDSPLASSKVNLDLMSARDIVIEDQIDGYSIEWPNGIPKMTCSNAKSAGLLFRSCSWQPQDVRNTKVTRAANGRPTIKINAFQFSGSTPLQVYVLLHFEDVELWDEYEQRACQRLQTNGNLNNFGNSDGSVDILATLFHDKRLSQCLQNCGKVCMAAATHVHANSINALGI
jgi:hypothetical protein